MYRNSCNHYQWRNYINDNSCIHWNNQYYNYNQNNTNPYIRNIMLTDYGPRPFVVNIDQATKQNNNYRTVLWTGEHFQLTLMSIDVGDDIGLEVHPTTDQFIRIEQGHGLVQMGDRKDNLYFHEMVSDDDVMMIPAGMWHNVTNMGNSPLKINVIYAPPEHPYGTIQETKAIAQLSNE
ncbi:MAG TPA: cupin domain-containing protein [Candidatus Paenibacillus intestinavium]|nr:cupin domain-containing protein [Candidatus Paenibacillus intestinavium]